jgi:hypothetical protein
MQGKHDAEGAVRGAMDLLCAQSGQVAAASRQVRHMLPPWRLGLAGPPLSLGSQPFLARLFLYSFLSSRVQSSDL